MSQIDDLPIDPDRSDAAPPYEPEPPRTSWTPVILVVLALVVLGGVGWYVWQRSRSAPATPAASAPPAAAVPDGAATPPEPVVLPPLEEMDPFLRGLLSSLSSHPQLVAWLATDDLLGSLATAIDRLAQGQTPARDLAPLRPSGGFATTTRRGVTMIAPASFARYDGLAAAVASVDPERLAQAFVTIEPRLNEAYTKQGHPGTVREALMRAAAVITATPDTPEELQLTPGVGGYAYADPRIEALTPAQKHLVRMGPANVATIREAVRRFAAALATTR